MALTTTSTVLRSDEWSDSDGDGVGDNADVFPLTASKSADSDGDGVGDDAEDDLDGDDILDVEEDSDEDGRAMTKTLK